MNNAELIVTGGLDLIFKLLLTVTSYLVKCMEDLESLDYGKCFY